MLNRALIALWPLAGLALLLAGAPAAAEVRPAIERFAINGGARTAGTLEVSLDTSVTGAPDSIRASERRDLAGAPWQAYVPSTPFLLAGPHGTSRRTIYVQVRRGDLVSTIASDSIAIITPGEDYVLPLDAARDYLTKRGWRFTAEKANPLSSCRLLSDRGHLVLSAWQGRASIDGVCDFVLFGDGGRLAPGWTFLRIERGRTRAKHCQLRFRLYPVAAGDRIEFRLRIIDADAPVAEKDTPDYRQRGCDYRIEKIVLRGPPGKDWRDAFVK